MTKEVWAPCSSCIRKTTHKVLHQHTFDDEYCVTTYAMLECSGCHRVCLGEFTRTDFDVVKHSYYPSPVSRKEPDWLPFMGIQHSSAADYDLGETGFDAPPASGNQNDDAALGLLLHEIYQAVHGGQHRLAAMGIRALLEQIMVSKVGDLGSFEKQLEAFEKAGFISFAQRDAMKDTLEVGHAAMHRAYKPTEKDVKVALDIVEGVMAPLYHHQSEAEKMADRVPPRAPRKQ